MRWPRASWQPHLQQWLTEHGVEFDSRATNVALLELINQHKPEPEYETVNIATEYGHTIIWTPPYHPELQEIEVIWAVAKKYCKAHPAQSWKELMKLANYAFTKHITRKTWADVHKKVIWWEDHYVQESGLEQAVYNEEDIESEDEQDEDDGEDEGCDNEAQPMQPSYNRTDCLQSSSSTS